MTASASISELLLAWYGRHARALPWRSAPGCPPPDPYRVWLSEVMLQQTTVSAVKPYYERFLTRWGDVDALAAAPEQEVMAAWAGGFTASEAELRALPGLGAYTAAAIAAIAFEQRAVVVDANVERVVARLFALAEPLPGVRKAIRACADRITPVQRAGDFAQAMMDLGATVCTARDPRCLACTLAQHCLGRRSGDPARLPVKPPRKARPERQGRAFWIEQGGSVWLVRRPGKGMLGGMRALPDDGWSARADGAGPPPLRGPWRPAGSVQHIFTHCALTLSVLHYDGADHSALDAQAGEWWPLVRLDEAGLPTAFAKAATRAMAGEDG